MSKCNNGIMIPSHIELQYNIKKDEKEPEIS